MLNFSSLLSLVPPIAAANGSGHKPRQPGRARPPSTPKAAGREAANWVHMGKLRHRRSVTCVTLENSKGGCGSLCWLEGKGGCVFFWIWEEEAVVLVGTLPCQTPPDLPQVSDPFPAPPLPPPNPQLPSPITPPIPRRTGTRRGCGGGAGGVRGSLGRPAGAPGAGGARGCRALCLLAGRSIPRQTPRLAACALSSPLISLSKWVCMDHAACRPGCPAVQQPAGGRACEGGGSRGESRADQYGQCEVN